LPTLSSKLVVLKMQKSLLITIVLILVVHGQNNEQESAMSQRHESRVAKPVTTRVTSGEGLVHGQSNDVEQDSANNTVYHQFMMKVDQKFETVNEKLANVLERLDRIIESCQNNVQSVPGMN
jgi:hypothetical protein